MPVPAADTHEDLIIRPAHAIDCDAVVAFCRHIWDGNDYVNAEVFDNWLNDVPGPMLVGDLAGRPVALAKVAVYPDAHAWFQGLRVDPVVQGQGIARRMHEASELAAAAAGASPWALLTADAGPTAVQRLCDAYGWTVQGRTRYLHLLPESDRDVTPAATGLLVLGVDDLPVLQASLVNSTTLAALGGWYTLDWECEPFTPDKLDAHLRAGQVYALPDRQAWGIVTIAPAGPDTQEQLDESANSESAPTMVFPLEKPRVAGYAWWALAEGEEPHLTHLARALQHQLCHHQRLELSLHVPTNTPWDHACQDANFWRDPAMPPKQFRLYTKTHP